MALRLLEYCIYYTCRKSKINYVANCRYSPNKNKNKKYFIGPFELIFIQGWLHNK